MLTNSLGSTDLVTTHAGYAKYRKLMVQCGVELYEMRPDAASRAIYTFEAGPSSVMGLHGKAALVDRKSVFIGTFNFDQRSSHINTEVGVLVYSPELAREIASALAIDLLGQNSWRVCMASDCDPGLRAERAQELAWTKQEGSRKECVTHEPSASPGRLFLRSLAGILPIESQL